MYQKALLVLLVASVLVVHLEARLIFGPGVNSQRVEEIPEYERVPNGFHNVGNGVIHGRIRKPDNSLTPVTCAQKTEFIGNRFIKYLKCVDNALVKEFIVHGYTSTYEDRRLLHRLLGYPDIGPYRPPGSFERYNYLGRPYGDIYQFNFEGPVDINVNLDKEERKHKRNETVPHRRSTKSPFTFFPLNITINPYPKFNYSRIPHNGTVVTRLPRNVTASPHKPSLSTVTIKEPTTSEEITTTEEPTTEAPTTIKEPTTTEEPISTSQHTTPHEKSTSSEPDTTTDEPSTASEPDSTKHTKSTEKSSTTSEPGTTSHTRSTVTDKSSTATEPKTTKHENDTLLTLSTEGPTSTTKNQVNSTKAVNETIEATTEKSRRSYRVLTIEVDKHTQPHTTIAPLNSTEKNEPKKEEKKEKQAQVIEESAPQSSSRRRNSKRRRN